MEDREKKLWFRDKEIEIFVFGVKECLDIINLKFYDVINDLKKCIGEVMEVVNVVLFLIRIVGELN